MFDITDDIKEVLKYTDLVLLDIKHIDSKKCMDLVGHANEKELAFARYLSDNNIPVWIRQVIVPGINDNFSYMKKLKEYLKKINNIEKIEFLPFHRMGFSKYEELGIDNPLKDTPAMDKNKCEELYNYFLKI